MTGLQSVSLGAAIGMAVFVVLVIGEHFGWFDWIDFEP